ncbi:MAG TPA: GNAT family N-acetyltransferase [bacterium]|nr:GNAT family N-acetyltransferase [bacterium]
MLAPASGRGQANRSFPMLLVTRRRSRLDCPALAMSDLVDPLQLRPFELADADTVAPWLDGPGLSRPRGSSAWPERLIRDQRIVAMIGHAGGLRLGLVRLDCGPDGVADLTLVVAPEHRRRGCGRQMFAQALQRAREVGMRRLVAYVDLTNEAAISFFEQVGFVADGLSGDRIRMERLVHAGGHQPPLDVGA